MSEWIDIDACVKLSGKSIATIRRAIKRLPADSIKKEGAKHLYDRALILSALGVDRADDTPLIEALRGQITMQGEQLKEKQAIIDSLLERQRETNILLGQLRLLTTAKEPTPTGKTDTERQHERIALLVAALIVLSILGTVILLSWR